MLIDVPEQLKGEFASGLRLIQILAKSRRSLGVTEVARQLGLAKSSSHDLLAKLVALGFVEQNPGNRRYHLGPHIFRFFHEVAENFGLNPKIASLIRETAEREDTSVYLSMLSAQFHYVVQAAGPLAYTDTLGVGGSCLGSSAGTVLLAQHPEEDWENYIVDTKNDGSAVTPCDRQKFMEDLRQAKKENVAWNHGSRRNPTCSVASSLPSRDGYPTYALAIVLPQAEWKQRTSDELLRMLERLMKRARKIVDPAS